MVQKWGKNLFIVVFLLLHTRTEGSQIKFLFSSLTHLSGHYGEKFQLKKSNFTGMGLPKERQGNLIWEQWMANQYSPSLVLFVFGFTKKVAQNKLLASNRHLNHISPFCCMCVMISDFNSQKKSKSKKGWCSYLLPPLPEGFFIFYFSLSSIDLLLLTPFPQ